MNRLQRMGNKLEEMRKEKERKVKRYWKLSSIERMEYDQKLDRINKENTISPLSLTIAGIKATVFIFFLFSLLILSRGYSIGTAIHLFKLMAFVFYRVITVTIILDILLVILDIFSGKREKEIKKLDERFKL